MQLESDGEKTWLKKLGGVKRERVERSDVNFVAANEIGTSFHTEFNIHTIDTIYWINASVVSRLKQERVL